jgi:large subunit ribosomal protein L33
LIVKITTVRFKQVAKKNKNVLVRLVSTAGTGYFLVKKRNPKTQTEKLSFKKYDPVVRKHVPFKEEKIK